MQLPFFNKPISEERVFFGLFLKEKHGIAFVMRMNNSDIKLLDQEKFVYPAGWEHLPEAVDEVILKLEQRQKIKIHESIFFIYSHFIDVKTKEIKKVYLDKIKDLVKKLNLKALGYIEAYEAVIYYYEKREELPLTAVMIELDHTNLSVFVYKRGELIYSKVLAHTDNLIDDLLMSFMEIKGKFVLPSRIILYNSKDLDNESTEIVTYRWSEELFVQMPRVEILKEHELIQGLLGVFAEQYGKNITKVGEEKSKPKEEVMGFVVGEDVATAEPAKPESHPPVISQSYPTPAPENQKSPGVSSGSILQNFGSFPAFLHKRIFLALSFVLIVLAVFLYEYFLHKAVLTLYLPAKAIKKDIELTSEDFKISTNTQSIELKDSKQTTGKKEIGEKAKGSVTIHNFDDGEKTFARGTSLESAGVKFNLDQEVKVASASVVTISGGLVKQPGKAKGSVTAVEIGPQSNLASGKQFKIADFSTNQYFAINESAFSGGTQKDIRTTAKQDLDDLKKSIESSAKKQKPEQSKNKVNSDVKVLSQLSEVKVVDENFDREVGEEADEINLEAKVEITSYSYSEKDLKEAIVKVLANEVEKDFELNKDKLIYAVEDVDKTGSEITLTVKSDAKSIRDVPSEEVLKKVKGKGTGALEKLLKENYKVEGYNLEVSPEIPLLANLMPLFAKNITVKVSSL